MSINENAKAVITNEGMEMECEGTSLFELAQDPEIISGSSTGKRRSSSGGTSLFTLYEKYCVNAK